MLSHRFSLPCIRRAVTLALLAASFLACPAFAAEKPAQVKGPWVVNMVQTEKKTFGYCLARAPYNNGLELAIALSPKREVNVGVMVPDAGYAPGERYPVGVSIDGKYKRTRPGIAAQPQLLMVPLGPDKEAIGSLKNGKTLSIEGPEDAALFSLKGTGKALDDLQRCVEVGTGKVKMPAQPPAGATAAPPASASAAPGKTGAAPKFPPGLLQMLKTAGLKDLKLVEVPDAAKAPVDFAWRTEGVLGGLRERPVPKDVTLDKMSGLIEEGYKKQCTGTFTPSVGKTEHLPGVDLRKADFSCAMQGQEAHVSLLVYLTESHLFSMFMHEAPAAAKGKAMHARDLITAQIRKMAKEQHPSGAAPSQAAPAPVPAPESAPPTIMRTAPPAAAAPSTAAPTPLPATPPPASSTTTPADASAPPPAVKSSPDAMPPPAVTDKK